MPGFAGVACWLGLAAASAQGLAPPREPPPRWAVRSIPGPRITWFSPESGLPVLRLAADEIVVGPMQVGGLRLGGAVPAVRAPSIRLHLDEVSDAWLQALAADWPKLARAAEACEGPLEVVLIKTGEPEQRVVSTRWRWRAFAPGLDLATPAEGRRTRAPELSLFWRGPGRGLGYALEGHAVEWPAFREALARVSATATHVAHAATADSTDFPP